LGKGTVSTKQRAKGLTWLYRYQTTRASDGKKVENTKVIGLVKDIGASEAAAWKEVGRQGLDNNIGQADGCKVTFRQLAEHFRHHELRKKTGIRVKAEETVDVTELFLDNWVLPRWGDKKAADIKPLEIEGWFEAVTSEPHGKRKTPLTWPTVTKLKSIMGQIFKHAQRHGLIPATVPAAVKAGVIPEGYKGRFGWHNLRHSLGTFLAANEVNLPVIQSILRHAKPTTTSLYTHRVNKAKLTAQAKFLDAIKVTSAVV
jgi:hypothetical protein